MAGSTAGSLTSAENAAGLWANATTSTVDSVSTELTEDILARHGIGGMTRRRWRRVRTKIRVVARFGRVLARTRRLEALRGALGHVACGQIDEYVLQEIAVYDGDLLLQHSSSVGSRFITLIDGHTARRARQPALHQR
jgi:hypothetical protein